MRKPHKEMYEKTTFQQGTATHKAQGSRIVLLTVTPLCEANPKGESFYIRTRVKRGKLFAVHRLFIWQTLLYSFFISNIH